MASRPTSRRKISKKFWIFWIQKVHPVGNQNFSSQPLENSDRLLLYSKTLFSESFSHLDNVVPSRQVDPLLEETNSKLFGIFKFKSPSCGKFTVFKLASWKFWQMTLLLKKCVSWNFQFPWPWAATGTSRPTSRRKNSKKFFNFFELKKSILWEIHSCQAKLLRVSTYYSSFQNRFFQKDPVSWAMGVAP